MSDKPAVLIMQRHLAPLSAFLESAYTVYRFWEGPPIEAGHAVRALVVAGEFPLDKHLIERLPDLGLIACFTVGYDGIDVAWARGRGIEVTHAPGANAEDVADHALGLMLGARRQIVAGDRALRAGAWTPDSKIITPSMKGQRVGIVGLGGIGAALAERCEALKMAVRWWGPNPKPDAPWPRVETLQELALGSDVLAVCARADDANRGLISKTVIEALGPGGLLVNVSRGQVVDEDALIAALKDGRLGAAALDVFEQEPTPVERWADVPNTVLTPHTGGATTESVQRMLALLMENLGAYFSGRGVRTPVP
jgi:lactate dehydrogenase-like 2-hydroxyacid dehydrogenase